MSNNSNKKTKYLTNLQINTWKKQTWSTATDDNQWITGSWLGSGIYRI